MNWDVDDWGRGLALITFFGLIILALVSGLAVLLGWE